MPTQELDEAMTDSAIETLLTRMKGNSRARLGAAILKDREMVDKVRAVVERFTTPNVDKDAKTEKYATTVMDLASAAHTIIRCGAELDERERQFNKEDERSLYSILIEVHPAHPQMELCKACARLGRLKGQPEQG